MRRATCPSRLRAQRHQCASRPGFDETAQLNATGQLAIACKPEASHCAAPCITSAFFYFPLNFDGWHAAALARWWKEHARPPREQRHFTPPFAQCRRRKRDEDWPALEMYERRTPATRTMRDVMSLLGTSRVKIVGASVARATTKAMQCSLASADLRDGPSGAVAQWLDWGWARYSSDNGGCDSVAAFRAARTARTRTRSCLRRGDRFERMLNTTDVVIVAYNPQASGHARVTLLCSSAHAL